MSCNVSQKQQQQQQQNKCIHILVDFVSQPYTTHFGSVQMQKMSLFRSRSRSQIKQRSYNITLYHIFCQRFSLFGLSILLLVALVSIDRDGRERGKEREGERANGAGG